MKLFYLVMFVWNAVCAAWNLTGVLVDGWPMFNLVLGLLNMVAAVYAMKWWLE